MQKLVSFTLLISVFSAFAMDRRELVALAVKEKMLKLRAESVFIPDQFGELELYHDGENFHVDKGNELKEIKKQNLDSVLRTMNQEALKSFLTAGYVSVNQCSDGEFSLEANDRLPGGGIIGANAGFWTGKFLVHFVAQAGIHIATAGVAILFFPAAAPFYYAAQSTLALPVEGLSNAVGIGMGIAGGVATGPV